MIGAKPGKILLFASGFSTTMHDMQTPPSRGLSRVMLTVLVAFTIVNGASVSPGSAQEDGRLTKSKRFGGDSQDGSAAAPVSAPAVEYSPFAAGGTPRPKKRTNTYSPFGTGSGAGTGGGGTPGSSSGSYEPFAPGSAPSASGAGTATPRPPSGSTVAPAVPPASTAAPLTAAPAAPLEPAPSVAPVSSAATSPPAGAATEAPLTAAPARAFGATPAGGGEQALQATAASINAAPAGDCGKSIGIWNYDRIPLTVYIYPAGSNVGKFKPQYPGLVTKAFEEWTAATHGVFKFKFVNQPTADITVQFVNATAIGRPGAAKNKSVNKELVKAEITLAMDTRNNDREILHIVEHEIGHALGLDHTSRSLGIMSATLANSDNVFVGEGDYNELRRIYGLDEQGRQITVAATGLDGFKKVVGAHLAGRLKSMPHPLTRPCDITLTLDSAGFMYSYNVSNDNRDKAPEIVAAVTRSPHYPASPTPFTGKIKMRVTVKPDFTVEEAEIVK